MVKCSFCGEEMRAGTGKLFVFKSGKAVSFCSSKCERNQLKLKRVPRKLKWTQNYKKA